MAANYTSCASAQDLSDTPTQYTPCVIISIYGYDTGVTMMQSLVTALRIPRQNPVTRVDIHHIANESTGVNVESYNKNTPILLTANRLKINKL